MKATDVEQREFLLSCAAWQDGLLQSYRSLHVTIQGFLIAAGAAVLAVQLTGAVQEQTGQLLTNAVFNVLFSGLMAFLFWLQRKTAVEMKGVVDSRAQDINHWHRLVMLSENGLEVSQRSFTYFKMWQQKKRQAADVDALPDVLTEEEADRLVGKGIGHTRAVLDVNLFDRMQLLWYSMLIASLGVTVWFGVLWMLSRCGKA